MRCCQQLRNDGRRAPARNIFAILKWAQSRNFGDCETHSGSALFCNRNALGCVFLSMRKASVQTSLRQP